jgi:hypothetical protein
MLRPAARLATGALVVLLLLAACARGTPPESGDGTGRPAAGASSGTATGDSLPVAIVEQSSRPVAAGDAPFTLAVTGGPARVDLVWQPRSGPCMLATPRALRSGDELVVTVERSGDPVALCLAGEVVYRYAIRVTDVPAGRWRVRVVEQPLGQAPVERGTGEAVVTMPGA